MGERERSAMRDVCEPNPKPAKRIRDPQAVSRFLLYSRWCEACGNPSDHAHHVLFRSHGGDDVPANLLALCHRCHRGFHDGSTLDRHAVGMAVRRRTDILDYLEEKAHGAFLDRVYPL